MTEKTLKQLFWEAGYAVNRDDQKGIGDKAIGNFLKVACEWLTQNNDDFWAKRKIDELLEELGAALQKAQAEAGQP